MKAMTSKRAVLRAKQRKKERGIALMMVIGAIAVLTVLLAEFQDETSAELASALSDRDSVQAEYMARSATNLARLLIATEPTIREAIAPLFQMMKRTPPQLPVWEFSDRLLGVFNDQEGQADFAATMGISPSSGSKNLGMPGGRFELQIVDEDSKLDVNLGGANDIAHIRLAKELMGAMTGPQYDELFKKKDATGNYHDRLQICSAIMDWADGDQNQFNCDTTQTATPSNGAEDAYYQLLQKPYFRKNAPYDSLEELHMIAGVDDDFWSTFVDPDPTNPKKRNFTVWGQGPVNVNGASPLTLVALVCAGAPTAGLCTDPLQMQAFISGVIMGKGISMGAPLFGSAKDFIDMMKGQGQLGPLLTTMLGMQPVKFQSESEFSKSIAIDTKVFSVYAVGVVKGYRRETRTKIHTVVDFRNAPSVNAMASFAATETGSSASASSASARPVASGNTNGATGDAAALQAALNAPEPGGTIVYQHIE